MVKKIDNNRPSSPVGATAVEPKQATKAADVSGAGSVQGATGQTESSRVRRPTRPMTAEERAHLFRLIHEEADKMFGSNGLPESQRETLEGAVRMTVDASVVEEEDSEKGSE